MLIISIVNQKGGTGKTTTSINLGSALAAKGKKVLLIDLDSQGNLGYSLGLEEGNSIADVFRGDISIEEAIQQKEQMDVIPSDMTLVDIELSMIDMEDRQAVLESQINSISNSYDYVLLDCPPSLSILAVNALFASQKVIIPMQLEVLSLQGLDQIITTINKINKTYSRTIEIFGILPVMVDKRRKLTEEVRDHIGENYDVNIFESMIRTNVKASEAPSFGQSVISYAPSSNSARDYTAFAQEIIGLK